MSIPPFITVDYMRDIIQDRTPGDNTIECDLFFTDKEIQLAIDRAATTYNSVVPVGVDRRDGGDLPTDPGFFTDIVISETYKSYMQRLARNMLSWSSGGTTVDLEKSRMEMLKFLKHELDAMWMPEARAWKEQINYNSVWRFM